MTAIRFGTDGWRAVIGDDFTFKNVRKVAQAIARYFRQQEADLVVVGYDTRFLSDRFAREAALVLAADGLRVLLTRDPTPTPALSWAVKATQAGGGVMITASHNPPEYNGIKLKAAFGGPALPADTEAVEEILEENLREGRRHGTINFHEALESGRITLFDARPSYFDQVSSLVDLQAIRDSGLKIVADSMFGAAKGYLRTILAREGMEITEVRTEFNPWFGGIGPEPIERNLAPLVEAVVELGADVGVATDGDGDRVGAVDEKGRFVDAHRIFALLLRHLVERKRWSGSVVKTFAGTRMVDRLAALYRLPFHETPVGFKHVCELALKEDVLIGGEESGGIGIKNHMPERDGILCSLLLVEILAQTGRSLSDCVEELMGLVGHHYFSRLDLRLDRRQKDRLLDLLERRPLREIAGFRVHTVNSLDGHKYLLGDVGWILFRPSGTEPVVRIYVEATSPDKVEEILLAGKKLAFGE